MLDSIEHALGVAFKVHRAWMLDPCALLHEVGPRIRGVVVGRKARLERSLLDKLPNLEIVARYGAGYDNIDVHQARARGIVVTNTPGASAEEVADFALGLLLCAVRQIPEAQRHVREGRWGCGPRFPLSASLRGRKAGIVGLGHIGKAVARRCLAFDLPVSYHGRSAQILQPYPYFPSLVAMAKDVDILIATLQGGTESRHLIGAEVLDALGPDGIFINVSRGSVVDQAALIDALEQRRILTAGLDVLDGEPQVPERLLALPHVVLTPHIGAGSDQAVEAMGRLLIDNVQSWFAGRGPLTPVAETPWPRS